MLAHIPETCFNKTTSTTVYNNTQVRVIWSKKEVYMHTAKQVLKFKKITFNTAVLGTLHLTKKVSAVALTVQINRV